MNNRLNLPVKRVCTFKAYLVSMRQNSNKSPKKGTDAVNNAPRTPKKEKHSAVTVDVSTRQNDNTARRLKYRLSLRFNQCQKLSRL